MTYKFRTNYGRIGTARSANLQAYYKFDGDLTDSSGNGFTLSVSTGTELYCRLPNQNYQAFKFDGSTRLERANETALEIAGAFTMHMLLVPAGVTTGTGSSADWIVGFGYNTADSGNPDPKNYLYGQNISASVWYSFTEYAGSGGADNIEWNVPKSSPAVGQAVFTTQTRDASGNVEFYVNGAAQTVAGMTNYPNPPYAGGSPSGVLAVGGLHNDSNRFYPGALAELQILNIELTAAQVLEDARKVMPWL